jgi:HD-GYP domain-containing protein (c-di-GMP phosphodiesterase class II)
MCPDITEHGVRTAWLAERLGERLGLAGPAAEALAGAAGTHDIGKHLLPQTLLMKPASLTRAERVIVQQHCAMGAWVLRQKTPREQPASSDAVAVALLHHEWWNGRGYPFGLSRREIPLAARIVAVADALDALCSERPYKAAWPAELARDYIRSRSGIQFDPACVEALLSLDLAMLGAPYAPLRQAVAVSPNAASICAVAEASAFCSASGPIASPSA